MLPCPCDAGGPLPSYTSCGDLFFIWEMFLNKVGLLSLHYEDPQRGILEAARQLQSQAANAYQNSSLGSRVLFHFTCMFRRCCLYHAFTRGRVLGPFTLGRAATKDSTAGTVTVDHCSLLCRVFPRRSLFSPQASRTTCVFCLRVRVFLGPSRVAQKDTTKVLFFIMQKADAPTAPTDRCRRHLDFGVVGFRGSFRNSEDGAWYLHTKYYSCLVTIFK